MEASQLKHDKDMVQNKEELENQIVQSVDDKKQHLAYNLLRYIKKDADIDWSSRAELIYKGEVIPGLHARDLFNDIPSVSNKSRPAPLGSEEFVQSLHSLNVPKQFVVNKARFNGTDVAPVFRQIKTNKKDASIHTPKHAAIAII